MKVLIVTLATTKNFLPQVELLDHALRYRFKTKYDVKIMVTQNIDISNYNWKFNPDVDIVPYIRCNGTSTDGIARGNYYRDTINKFWMLLYTDYDYVVFADGDSFPLYNFDNLIEEAIGRWGDLPFIGSTRFGGKHIVPAEEDFKVTEDINGGFYIMKPNIELCFEIMNKFKYEFVNDEKILNNYFTDCLNFEMHKHMLNLLLNAFFHDGGEVKLFNLFPTRTIDLELCDNEMYYLIFENWDKYRKNNNLLQVLPVE